MEIVPQDRDDQYRMPKIRIKDINDIVIGQDCEGQFSAYDLVGLSILQAQFRK